MKPKIIFEKSISVPITEKVPSSDQDGLAKPIQRLAKTYRNFYLAKPTGEIAAIHVDEVASKVAAFYEKIRRVVDWKEENILRRSAIERILKRGLIEEITKTHLISLKKNQNIAESLVHELIRGGHLPNDTIPQTKVPIVKQIIQKYVYLLKEAPFPKNSFTLPLKKKINFYNWLLAIAAAEIEEVLAPPIKESALIRAMTKLMNQRIRVIPDKQINEKEKLIQTYIAVHRALFGLDDALIAYHLLQYHDPNWINPTAEYLPKFCQRIFITEQKIKHELDHPQRKDFLNICDKTDPVFTLLNDVLESFKNDPAKIESSLSHPPILNQLITKFYHQRLQTLKKRLFRLGIYSTLSVFVSNWFSYFIVEVPLAKLIYQKFNFLAIAVDFLLPSLFMFALVAAIHPPKKDNLKKLMAISQQFIYQNESKNIYEIKLNQKIGFFLHTLIATIYSFGGIISLFSIGWLFYLANIPITSVFLDTIQIALNVFAGLIIRNKAKELTVEEKTSFGEFFLDTLSIPVAKIGSFLANKWQEYNVFSVFLNIFVEVPFITAIDFIENWSKFLKERKAELH